MESFLQTSSELEGQYVKNTRAEWPWGDLEFWGSSESILGLQAAQLLPFWSSMTLWLLHSHFLVTKYLCGQRTRQWFFPLTVYWKKHTPCSLISDEKKIKKQTGEVTGTLPKKKTKRRELPRIYLIGNENSNRAKFYFISFISSIDCFCPSLCYFFNTIYLLLLTSTICEINSHLKSFALPQEQLKKKTETFGEIYKQHVLQSTEVPDFRNSHLI